MITITPELASRRPGRRTTGAAVETRYPSTACRSCSRTTRRRRRTHDGRLPAVRRPGGDGGRRGHAPPARRRRGDPRQGEHARARVRGDVRNEAFGPVVNPAAPDRIPGGSSGGSGAAVAAGPLRRRDRDGHGGSVRLPASLCGVSGIRPTYGAVSNRACSRWRPRSTRWDRWRARSRTYARCSPSLPDSIPRTRCRATVRSRSTAPPSCAACARRRRGVSRGGRPGWRRASGRSPWCSRSSAVALRGRASGWEDAVEPAPA